jgi:hypothetical protein
MSASLAIAIPSKNERFLDNTIRDILEKAQGEVVIYPILDGYDAPRIKDPRVRYMVLPKTSYSKKRQAINEVVKLSRSDYVMSVDAHCMFDKGFDVKLIESMRPDWVMVPRRHRLDAENWCLQDQCDSRPAIDYEYIIWYSLVRDRSIHGFKWDERTLARIDKPIDDILTFQGSCWIMARDWFQRCGFMDLAYKGWGQEAEEVSFTTWQQGGRVVVNKNTWYAHLHKGPKYGRMYHLSREECRQSYRHSFKTWVVDNTEFLIGLIKRFAPLPNWPLDWERRIWEISKQPAPISA